MTIAQAKWGAAAPASSGKRFPPSLLMITAWASLAGCRRRFLPVAFAIFLFLLHCSTVAGEKMPVDLSTDRACYSPGATVHLALAVGDSARGLDCVVRYYELNMLIAIDTIHSVAEIPVVWSWKTPERDFTGYLVTVTLQHEGTVVAGSSIGVDVSSAWSRFPRYGFVSWFPPLSVDSVEKVVERLNRYHINGVQFYDWQFRHHRPLKGTVGSPADHWKDIANRDVFRSTIEHYIDAVHKRGMKAMAYNLLYGAYAESGAEGVDTSRWGLYRLPNATERFKYVLPAGWASQLFFMDPGNEEWRTYILRQEQDVFRAFQFDGWHVDQVGDPGPVYDVKGNQKQVKSGFAPFLIDASRALRRPLVMNAVNDYGQEEIARTPVEFLYTEIWDCARTYGELQAVIDRDRAFAGGKKSSIVAAYMDYDRGGSPGSFSTPGVLLTDAVIMASGGAHMELGEHMLCHEYFPNGNLAMPADLQRRLMSYYDFFVAYERILRGDSVLCSTTPLPAPGDKNLFSREDIPGKIWYFGKETADRRVYHFINLSGCKHNLWRDAGGDQTEPAYHHAVPLRIPEDRSVKRVWCASPELQDGVPMELPITRADGMIACSLPELDIWSIVVIDYVEKP